MELAEIAETEAGIEVTVNLGVDTHQDTHVGVILDGLGRRLDTLSVSANTAGYRKLLGWARGFRHRRACWRRRYWLIRRRAHTLFAGRGSRGL